MNILVLEHKGLPIGRFPIGPRPLEVGGHPSCDVVVDDGRVEDRELLVRDRGDTVVAYDLREGRRGERPRVLRLGERRVLGAEHAITRVRAAASPNAPFGELTESLDLEVGVGAGALTLTVGRGPEARRARLEGRPIWVGSGGDNTLVLGDRAVSGRHCRLDPVEGGALLRDLGSRNGIWVRGLRVERARIAPGESFRVGRTDLHLSAPATTRDGLVVASGRMRDVMRDAERFAPLDWPVLIEGESGVGKELVAHSLHKLGPRTAGPFVAINAGGLPRELVESELFGHEKGAFTGAHAAHRGVFERAHGGTLFLDELGELPLELQARLLRVLETWQIRRVGGEESVSVDVRLVTATHRSLGRMVEAGSFRHDLLYRVRRLVLEVPPLRARPDDILPLAERFLDDIAAEVGPRCLSREAESRLLVHRWSGNVRELRNVVSAAAIDSPAGRIEGEDIVAALTRVSGAALAETGGLNLREVLARHGGNSAAAARSLGIARSTFRDRLRRELSE